jgi:hypothetical protein
MATTVAQTRPAPTVEFPLADTRWEIAYQDTRLGEIRGIAFIGSGQAVSGLYQDPRTGEEHQFTGVVRLEMRDSNPVAVISLQQSGPFLGSPLGVADIGTAPGQRIDAKLGDLSARLSILETSPVTLELELGDAGMGGLWLAPETLASPLRNATQSQSRDGQQYAAGPEAWLPSVARFTGQAEISAPGRDLFDGSVNDEQRFTIELSGIGIPDWEAVNDRTVDFGPLADSLSVDTVLPNDGMFGRDLTLRVTTTTLPNPGTYPLTVNDIEGEWTLRYRDLRPSVRLLRQIRQDQTEEMSEIYVGESFLVEVEFGDSDTSEGLGFTRYPAVVLDASEQQHAVTLTKSGRARYRSAPLSCVSEEVAAAASESAIVCIDQAQLSAIVQSGPYDSSVQSVPVVRAPSPLWDQAMAAAGECRTGDFEANVRGVSVQRQVHAALILLRDELRTTVTANIEDINQAINPDPVRARAKREADLQTLSDQARRTIDNPLFFYQVSLPPTANSTETVSLRDALTGNYEPRLDKDARQAYEQIVIGQAQGEMMAASERTRNRLAQVGDCNLEGLLQFGKLSQPVLGEALKSKLLRAGLPGESAWMPDLAARGAVDATAGIVAAVRDEDNYRQMRTDFAVVAFTVATAGTALVASASRFAATSASRFARFGTNYSKTAMARFAAAANIGELTELSQSLGRVIDAQTNGQAAVDRAMDLVPVIGTEAYEQARAEKLSQIRQAVVAAAASGAGAAAPRVLAVVRAPSDGVEAGTRISLGRNMPGSPEPGLAAGLSPEPGAVSGLSPERGAAAGLTANATDEVLGGATRIEQPAFTVIQDAPPSGRSLRDRFEAFVDDSPALPPAPNRVEDFLDSPAGSYSNHLSDAEAARLFEPGRDLTSVELIQKLDLMRVGDRVPVNAIDPALREGLERVFANPSRPRAAPVAGNNAPPTSDTGASNVGATTVPMGPNGTLLADPFDPPGAARLGPNDTVLEDSFIPPGDASTGRTGTAIIDPERGTSLNRMPTQDMLNRAGPYRGIWIEDLGARVADQQRVMPSGTSAKIANPEQPMVLDPAEAERYIYTIMPDGDVRYVAQKYRQVATDGATQLEEVFKHSMLTEGGPAGQSGEIIWADGRWHITNESGRYGSYVIPGTTNVVSRSPRSLNAARDILQRYGVQSVGGQAVTLEPQFVRH